MPIYEYLCEACGKQHEVMQKISEGPLTTCPDCGGEMKRLISSTSFVLKGTGWYATDYASDKKKGRAEKSTGKKDSKTDAKPETKGESKPSAKESPVSA